MAAVDGGRADHQTLLRRGDTMESGRVFGGKGEVGVGGEERRGGGGMKAGWRWEVNKIQVGQSRRAGKAQELDRRGPGLWSLPLAIRIDGRCRTKRLWMAYLLDHVHYAVAVDGVAI